MKSLYSYFGLLDLHSVDSPGHSLYQLGLIDSIKNTFGEDSFDFYSYYPEEILKNHRGLELTYPECELGEVFTKYQTKLINHYIPTLDSVLEQIKNKQYVRLYLKARFRNISTLTKKWKDALAFEKILDAAINSGYQKTEIIVLDTDLSLPDSFYTKYSAHITIIIPSIDFPGISEDFLIDCVDVHRKEFINKKFNSVFYGNINTTNYKSGNSKSQSLLPTLELLEKFHTEISDSKFIAICKESDLDSKIFKNTTHIARHDRQGIWQVLTESLIMVNVTKEKYDTRKFIPARIYEAIIFGMIPISYKFEFLSKTFSFTTEEDLTEILKYLFECDPENRFHAYLHFINQYITYAHSIQNFS